MNTFYHSVCNGLCFILLFMTPQFMIILGLINNALIWSLVTVILCWLINYCFKIVCWGPQFLFCCKCVVDVFMQRLHTFQWCLNSFLFLKQQKRFSPKSFLLYSANTHRVTKSKIFFLGYWGRFSWYRRTQKCKGNVGNDCAGRLVVNISPI